jgi:hypothetical protein
MINTLEEYVTKYINPYKNEYFPGEHHFVALYLAPKLFKLGNIIPDYINPDGMKRLPGDLIYSKDLIHKLAIEVKFFKINFTKTQCNDWLNFENGTVPNYIVALGKKYLLIQNWFKFVNNYKGIILKTKGIHINKIESGYTPTINVDEYCIAFPEENSVINYSNGFDEQKIDSILIKIIGVAL